MLSLQKYLTDKLGSKVVPAYKGVHYKLVGDIGIDCGIDLADVQLTKSGKFVNINLTDDFMRKELMRLLDLETLLVQNDPPLKVMVDFSSPNVAKELHVGHLRSTVIGDVICRLNEAIGNKVDRINHIGDFGLPFGMIIEYIIAYDKEYDSIQCLHTYYKLAKIECDKDLDFKKRALQRTRDLQRGEEQSLALWKDICRISSDAYNDIYRRLDIELHDKGESTYVDQIPALVEFLDNSGLTEMRDGRKIIDMGGELPLTILKSDGGFTYDTTDMTALKYRVEQKPDAIYYVVDKGQSLHFKLMFDTAHKLGWTVPMHHISFGVVKGTDRKRLKARSGDAYPLRQLLDEAVAKVTEVSDKVFNNQTIDCERVAYTVVKFYELIHSCARDYVFDMDEMVRLDGKTGMYILYTLVRAKSIVRKAPDNNAKCPCLNLTTDSQRNLALDILKFPDVFDDALHGHALHRMALYLYDICVSYSKFITKNRVLLLEDKVVVSVDETNMALTLCFIKIVKYVLGLLGLYELEYV